MGYGASLKRLRLYAGYVQHAERVLRALDRGQVHTLREGDVGEAHLIHGGAHPNPSIPILITYDILVSGHSAGGGMARTARRTRPASPRRVALEDRHPCRRRSQGQSEEAWALEPLPEQGPLPAVGCSSHQPRGMSFTSVS